MQSPSFPATAFDMEVAKITVNDVEELSYSVDPWQFQMRQLSSGMLHSEMHIAQLGDIFVSDEYWSNKISATGQTPPGYFLLAGPKKGVGFSWCGSPTSDQRLAYAPDARNVDFLTQDKEHHWTLLIPRQTAKEYLGEEIVESLSGDQTSLQADKCLIRHLSCSVISVLKSIKENQLKGDRPFYEANCKEQIMAAASQLLLNANEFSFDEIDRNRRSAAYRKARQHLASLDGPISVKELANHVKVSRRTLEIAFREATGLSPKTFMQRARLSALFSELRSASPNSISVTHAAQELGFTELGRTAGYYRQMFGECPSATLSKDPDLLGTRFSDLLG